MNGHKALDRRLPGVVLVTNAHVIPEGLPWRDARVTFRGLGNFARRARSIISEIWSSPSGELDATILQLDGYPRGVTPCPVAAEPPTLATGTPPRAYIIGHPNQTMNPQFSLQDNVLLGYDEIRMHYRAPTEWGSSGSPVFDRRWDLLAIHHEGRHKMPRLHGGGTYQANEGIRITAIASRLGELDDGEIEKSARPRRRTLTA